MPAVVGSKGRLFCGPDMLPGAGKDDPPDRQNALRVKSRRAGSRLLGVRRGDIQRILKSSTAPPSVGVRFDGNRIFGVRFGWIDYERK